MSDYLLSLIRTLVPAAVGAVLGWLALHGLHLPADQQTAVTAAVVGAATVVYYALVRAAESRWPWLGGFLGAARAPAYVRRARAVKSVNGPAHER